MQPRWRAAGAGALAATVWGLAEPLDRRLLRHDYSDIAVLGKACIRGPAWRPLGFAIHAVNGAAFGLVYDSARRRSATEPRTLALTMAVLEHLSLFPLGYLVDRYHPARGEPGVAPLFTWRGFGQASIRHVLFGLLLGRLAGPGS